MSVERSRGLFDLRGEIAAVVGATGALGGAIARGLAQAGARVAVLGRSVERGEACVAAIEEHGGEAIFVPTDATRRDSLAAAREELESRLGVVGVLVNAAGGNSPNVTVTEDLPFEDLELEEWRSSLDLNLSAGALLPCQVFGPGMLEHGAGSIINIASVSAHLPLTRVVCYSAAKAAVLNLTRFLAGEWGARGVRVNSITPGFFPADQNRRLLYEDDGEPTPRARSILDHTPMRRFGDPEEVVGAAVFLASSGASSFVNGADIRVDGGFLSQTI